MSAVASDEWTLCSDIHAVARRQSPRLIIFWLISETFCFSEHPLPVSRTLQETSSSAGGQAACLAAKVRFMVSPATCSFLHMCSEISPIAAFGRTAIRQTSFVTTRFIRGLTPSRSEQPHTAMLKARLLAFVVAAVPFVVAQQPEWAQVSVFAGMMLILTPFADTVFSHSAVASAGLEEQVGNVLLTWTPAAANPVYICSLRLWYHLY